MISLALDSRSPSRRSAWLTSCWRSSAEAFRSGRRGVGEVLLFRGADDGGGYDRVAQDPGQRDLGHRHAVLFGGLLDGVRDGLVVVGQHPAGDVVGVAAGGLLAPGPGETALRERAPRDLADALVG